MANSKETSRKSFYEVVFQGKPKVVRAYLAGLIAGSGHGGQYFFSFEDGVFHEGKVEKLTEMLHVRALDCHVIVDAQTSALLKKQTRQLPKVTGLTITSHKHIRTSSLKFEFQAFAKRYNDEIEAVFNKLPAGLRLEDYRHKVKLDPKAKGVEAYSTAHDYEANGSGKVIGRIDLLIDFKGQLDNYPLIKAEDIRLNLA